MILIIKNLLHKSEIFLRRYPSLYSVDSMDAIKYSLEHGLTHEELAFILSGKYQNLSDFPISQQNKILKILKELKDKKMLDHVDTTLWKDFWNLLLGTQETNEIKENPDLKRVVAIAEAEIGITENNGANKYFRDQGMRNSARGTPWCAAFINWVLKKAGLPGTDSNLAKSFINMTGMGHALIKASSEKGINGNWGNKVAYSPLPKYIRGYAIPTKTGLIVRQGNAPMSKIPDGAILVIDRNIRTRSGRRVS